MTKLCKEAIGATNFVFDPKPGALLLWHGMILIRPLAEKVIRHASPIILLQQPVMMNRP
jgi:hypothetical protein